MPINTNELLKIVGELADDRNIRVAIAGSLKGAALTGATTLIGGLLLGPLGLAVGGIAGGITAASVSRNSFRSVTSVILEDMSPRQRAILAGRLNNVLRDFAVTDLAILLPLLSGNLALNEAMITTLVSFLQNDMRLSISK